MRSDMGKVITERPRSKSRLPTAKFGKTIAWRGWDEDYAEPKFASGSQGALYGWEEKQFTDVLGPIYKFLNAQVGRPWNKVYSELCQVLDKRKLTHKHVFDHVEMYVERHVRMGRDGQYYPKNAIFSWNAVKGLFVCPRTGLIRRQVPREEPRPPKPLQRLEVSPDEIYEKLDGIWYRLTLRRASKVEIALGHPKYLPGGRRQLGKKDLRELEKRLA